MTGTPYPLDVLIIGTGFSGTYLLHRLLNLHYRVLALDGAPSFGGVWAQNTYPGARVDIPVPEYQFSLPELSDWTWKQRFPGREELQAYFAFCEKKLGRKGEEGLAKHCVFEVWVESVVWDDEAAVWEVRARDGRTWRARWVVSCIGYAAKPFAPDLPGLGEFGGVVRHTGQWEKRGAPEIRGKRVGVVGTGASGVQLVQTIASEVESLTVFQQTPALAIPMRQQPFDSSFTRKSPEEKAAFFTHRLTIFDGALGPPLPRSAKTDTPAQRQEEFDRLWAAGGLAFWTCTYQDLYTDPDSNALVYAGWRDRVRPRVRDAKTAEVLAPETMPYAFGTKRVPLEEGYYETFNQPNVQLVDLRTDPIKSITRGGVELASGQEHELDVLVFATGFDVGRGGYVALDVRGVGGRSLSQAWGVDREGKEDGGTRTYLGLAVAGFPNLLMAYAPQSPSGTLSGPVSAEVQGEWMVGLLEAMRAQGKTRIEAREEAQEEWTQHANGLLKGTLFEGTKSYYWGENVPGKRRGLVYYFGGLPTYKQKLDEEAKGGYKGFNIA
ncbi:MAG: hypothetical protein M1821_008980 [Bathelium mastoideum]|nr:MAG: hypothetical protein M1821_008980 [Bathelium mastoideum]